LCATLGQINGVTGTTNFGTLTEVAGAITGLTIIQPPTDTLVNVAIAPAITVRATDQFTNNVSGQNIAVALQAGTGALSGTSPRVTNANGIATFNDLQIDTVGSGKVLRFSFGGVTVDSNPFNINVAGITVNPTGGLITTETGDTDNFTMVLTSQPANDVTIGLSSSDTSEGTVNPTSLTFTNGNWNTPQTVTIYGVDDVEVDGDKPYMVITAPAVSADGNYNTLDASNVSVVNIDDDMGGGETLPGINDFSDVVTGSGQFTQEVTATSNDKQVEMTIDAGVIGQTSNGQPLSQISIFRMYSPPAPPEQASVIGLTYDFRPSGATFNQPVTITFTYNPNNIPAGVDEEDLSIALYNESTGEWVVLDNIVVDTVNHIITGETTHFSAFTVMAFTAPAAFSVSNLALWPAEVYVDEASTVTVTVTNTGDLSGTYDVVLMIDDVVAETMQVTVDGHASQMVSFEVSRDTAGTYEIAIGTLSGILTVIEEPAPTPAPTETPAPTPTPTEEAPVLPQDHILIITSTPTPLDTSTPAPTPSSTPTSTYAPTPAPAQHLETNWGLIGGIIGAVVVVAGGTWLALARRRD
jgi:hypothetical protein